MLFPTLETARLRLRPFRADDRAVLFSVFSDPQVVRYWSHPPWTDLAQVDEFLAPLLAPLSESSTMLPWGVADLATDELVGTTTIFALRRDQGRAEIGYSLHRSHWGKGYAREAVTRALAYGFEDLGLRRFEADIDPRNVPSLALCERLGFQREGYLRARWLVAGEVCDTVLLGLLASELRR
jgi:ribosomal-protein-alanine N-acetyltransferase